MKVNPNGLEVIVAVIISFFILKFLSHYLQPSPIPKNQYKTIFISGTDTIVVPDLSIVDLTKCKATDFGKDTINHFYYYRFGKKEVDSERYFFVSYRAYERGSSGSIDGENWFTTTGGFPPKRMIEDSVIMPYLPLKKSCYQNFIIRSIFEFKTKQDYLNFNSGYKSGKIYKNKINCTSIFKLPVK